MTFESIIDRVLSHEGGYTPGGSDPGGETKWGISKRSYPSLTIKTLTREQAIEIYRKDFWNKLKASTLYDGVAFQLMDFAVNSGVNTAVRYYQRALNVADDGHFGPISQKAARDMCESDQILRLLAERLEYISKFANFDRFGRGWVRRVAENLRYGAQDS